MAEACFRECLHGIKLTVKPCSLLVLAFVFTVLGSTAAHAASAGNTTPVYVILWFDTEDYLLPASDDAAKRLAELLTERKIRATFKVVGEKARTLERRGRTDVIRALKQHAIAYHSDFHSVHPTPSEYLAECGLLDGIQEFVRREGDGATDIRRIFGVKTLACYGQPGSSWGAQTIAGLRQIGVAPRGVPCYVDEGTHIGLDEKPFWYLSALNVYHMGANYTRMDLHDPAAVEPSKKKVSAIADRLRTKDGGGLISIFYHPCEWVHQQFWDGVNFARGANPPREEWKAPPQRTAEETHSAFRRFGEYIDHIRSIPDVRFITAEDLPDLYADASRQQVSEVEVGRLAEGILSSSNGVGFQVIGQKSFSLADQFELLARALTSQLVKRGGPLKLKTSGVWGPDQTTSGSSLEQLAPAQFRDTLIDVADFVATEGRVPARIFVGAEIVRPADFLYAMAFAWNEQNRNGRSMEKIPLGRNIAITTERYVAKDTPDLFGGWVIHKEGFRAPKILEIARLQTWTLKPALLKRSAAK
jgi:hypothetical protein